MRMSHKIASHNLLLQVICLPTGLNVQRLNRAIFILLGKVGSWFPVAFLSVFLERDTISSVGKITQSITVHHVTSYSIIFYCIQAR